MKNSLGRKEKKFVYKWKKTYDELWFFVSFLSYDMALYGTRMNFQGKIHLVSSPKVTIIIYIGIYSNAYSVHI
jgi:hypothetical protein